MDIPRKIGFTLEYSRIVRMFKVERNSRISDYGGSWKVIDRFEPPRINAGVPFELPTIIRLSNSITISDMKGYGDIYLESLAPKTNVLSDNLYEADSITLCSFPWEFENGTLEVKSREYQIFLPVYTTNLGYQNKLDELFALLKGEKERFSLILDEENRALPQKKYDKPPEINPKIPRMSKKVKMIRVRLGEEILLLEYSNGIWNTHDWFEKDSSILFEAKIPGTYTFKFTSTEYVIDYFITVIDYNSIR